MAPSRARIGPVTLLLLAVAAGPSSGPVRAQETAASPSETLSDADRAEARALFAAGAAAIDAGRWADAVTSFRRAYTLTRVPSALFNAAFALRALGRYREAVRAFDEVIGLERTSEEMRTEASSLRDDARAHLAVVRLLGIDEDVRHVIRVDGEAIEDSGARPFVLTLDPGRHVVDAVREGHERWEWTGTLENGVALDLAVELVAIAPPDEGPIEPAPERHELVEEPWLWIVIGLVVAGGAAAVGGWYADDQAQLRPESPQVVRF